MSSVQFLQRLSLSKAEKVPMKSLNTILALSFLMMLSACAKDSSTSGAVTPNGNKGPEQKRDTSEMTLQESLAAKYDSVILTCNAWTRVNNTIVLTDSPDGSSSVDLLKDSSLPKTISLNAQDKDHYLSAQIYIKDIKLSNLGHGDSDGNRWLLINSPVISGSFSLRTQNVRSGKVSSSNGATNPEVYLYENIPYAHAAALESRNTTLTIDYVKCTLVTKVKPQYEDEWTQDVTAPKKNCVLADKYSRCMIQRN